MSVLLRPARGLAEWSWLSLVMGLAAVSALEQTAHQAPARPLLKWPNDVLVEEGPAPGKLCGILSERHETPTGPAAVVGIGINIDLAPDELPVPTASSLAASGLCTDKEQVVAALLTAFAGYYEEWSDRGQLSEAYTKSCATIGRRVRIELGQEKALTGGAIGIDPHGHLLVQTDEAAVISCSAGDVVHLRPGD